MAKNEYQDKLQYKDHSTNKSVRIQGIRFFLTYPQCDMKPIDVLDKLQDIVAIEDYVIAQEDHKDGNTHIHAYIKLFDKLCTTDMHKFDLGEFHGNYQVAKNAAAVQKYCKKEGNYITNIEFEITRDVIDIARKGNIKQAFNNLVEHMPMEVIQRGSKLVENLNILKSQSLVKPYVRDDFHDNFHVMLWERKYKTKKALWIHGPTNTGKTEYAKTLFDKPLLVRHMDQLRGINTHFYDGIIFDDMSFSHWPRESVIHLCDLQNASGINIKHGVVELPAKVPRVFVSNVPIFNEDPTKAINRRIYYAHIETDLRKNKTDGYDSDDSGTGDVPSNMWIKEDGGAQCNITQGTALRSPPFKKRKIEERLDIETVYQKVCGLTYHVNRPYCRNSGYPSNPWCACCTHNCMCLTPDVKSDDIPSWFKIDINTDDTDRV